MGLKRPMPGEYNRIKEEPFDDLDFAKRYPLIHSHISERTYEDGKPRTTSTLLVFVEDGVLRLCINDRDNLRSAFLTGPTLELALCSLEDKLSSETLEWRIKNQTGFNQARTPF